MTLRPLVLSLALSAPLFAQAGYSINNSAFNCSAALSFANSTGLEAHCAGNFSVTGGTWTSDTKIALSADGSLTLDGVAMTAPIIELLSPQMVVNAFLTATGGSVRIDAPRDLSIVPPLTVNVPPRTGGTLQISPGATINVAAAPGAPQPNAFNQFGIPEDGLVLRNSEGRLLVGSDLVINANAGEDVKLVLTGQPPSTSPALSTISSVPEPKTYALALTALATWGASAARARRRKV